jgi:transcriptional regulator with XRE-family HTH domain
MTETLSGRAAANLRGEIARRNFTQEEFADKAGISRNTLGNLLAGRTVIDLDRLETFARLLEIEPAKLINH